MDVMQKKDALLGNMVQAMLNDMGCPQMVQDICKRLIDSQEQGHVCLDLSKWPGEVIAALETTSVIANADNNEALKNALFVKQGHLLYTRRNWQYEQVVRSKISEMLEQSVNAPISVPQDGCFKELKTRQREGVELMCNHVFSVLTGGPGTGKTYTIARAVKLVQEQQPQLRLALLAPTGKAAARVKESMEKEAQKLNLPTILDSSTIHRLLESEYDLVRFKHNKHHLLEKDWLIVDEASMVDLPLMAKLLEAMPEGCRLTLVGDVNQLASVEEGHVFGDLCRMKNVPICVLNESNRFEPNGEIDRLARAVNTGEGDETLDLLREQRNRLVSYCDISQWNPQIDGKEPLPGITKKVEEAFDILKKTVREEDAVTDSVLNHCRVLCALREGPFGVKEMNRFIVETLGANCPIPMMITQNDLALDVYNGDVGVVMPERKDILCLPGTGKSLRKIPLALLPQLEVSFATTIHKSQGSEYDEVIIVLPDKMSDNRAGNILTREILYTAITRTKGTVLIYGGGDVIKQCTKAQIVRKTGLAESI